MHALLLPLLAAVPLALPADAGTLLTYRGQIVAERDERETSRKEITYRVLVNGEGEKGTDLLWMVSEKGHGSASWIDQFGRLEVDARGRAAAGEPAAVLYEHAEGYSVVPLLPPVLGGPEGLSDGATWRENRLQYEVDAPPGEDAAKDAWRVVVSSAIGHKRTVLVEKETGMVRSVQETVFMGPGKEHDLTLVLTDRQALDGETLGNTRKAFAALLSLREALEHQRLRPKVSWNEEQLALLKDRLSDILDVAADTPLADLTLRGAGDAKLQKGIAAALEKLAEQYVGQPAPQLDLPAASLSGPALKSKDLEGKVVVLHLWPYRDNPLVEPYGQIGYLDFLYRRHKDDGLVVFGIAVDDRLDRDSSRSSAIRSVRKLQAFMNLGYPVVLGGSEVLDAFGDPTRLGAELPLFVVIDRAGKIAHYHSGHYEVDRDSGLKALDEVVTRLMKEN